MRFSLVLNDCVSMNAQICECVYVCVDELMFNVCMHA